MLKDLFVPHHGNDYRPHFLRHKRTCFYGVFFIVLKIALVSTVLMVPDEAWLSPEVMGRQETEITILVNNLRDQNKQHLLFENSLLKNSARAKASDMETNQYFDHTSSENKGVKYFFNEAGYKYSVGGENLAIGFADAKAIVKGWEKSPAHYANIIDKEYKDLGIGVVSGFYKGERTMFTVAHFGAPGENNSKLITNDAQKKINQIAGVQIPDNSNNIYNKYLMAKNLLSDWFSGMFAFTKTVYVLFFILFAWALAINIVIEIKRQHPHIILNATLLLSLLFILIKF